MTYYATPVVLALKKDEGVRLCGDYKTSVNPCLDTDRYSLPRVGDLFAALAGGQEFSKIDLNRAYHPVNMGKHLIRNTPKKLFAVNRLPFRDSSEPVFLKNHGRHVEKLKRR